MSYFPDEPGDHSKGPSILIIEETMKKHKRHLHDATSA